MTKRKNYSGPRMSPATRSAIESAPTLEETMRIAGRLESGWLQEGWSDEQQSAGYAVVATAFRRTWANGA